MNRPWGKINHWTEMRDGSNNNTNTTTTTTTSSSNIPRVVISHALGNTLRSNIHGGGNIGSGGEGRGGMARRAWVRMIHAVFVLPCSYVSPEMAIFCRSDI
ncbi:hypothetical protein Pmani_039134 [Petrolisthes manimaculis]|uniref:Uncharacterized protein n=1 Tax=Petrolisthes manimaculis TaxID=1843537 RepID=A0AAE1NFL0_9EUCA|nr:hypothetical protein Pmani_039134 [Petrolisthes manimaculis]